MTECVTLHLTALMEKMSWTVVSILFNLLHSVSKLVLQFPLNLRTHNIPAFDFQHASKEVYNVSLENASQMNGFVMALKTA